MSEEDNEGPPRDKRSPDPDSSTSPYADKRPRVLDEEAADRSWFHTIGFGKTYLRGSVSTASLSFIKKNGYFLHESKEKSKDSTLYLTHFCQDKKPLLLEAGPLNLVFLNDYIAWSGGNMATDKVLMDGGVAIGSAFRDFNPKVREWLEELGIKDEAADAEVIRMFRSDQVVENLRPDSLRINFSKQPGKEKDFLVDDMIKLPEYAGYWRLSFPRIKDVPTPMPLKWKTALDEKRFSYKFYPSNGNLFFSNTLGAKYGLPPTAKHLGLPKLDVGREPQESQDVLPDGCCSDCQKHKEEIKALQNLVTDLLARKKTMGAFSFPAGVTKFTAEGSDFAFQYRGKVVVKK